MSEYELIPVAVAAPYDVAAVALVAATTKTVLQVAVPGTTDIELLGWGVSFNGVTAAAVPVQCEIAETNVAATMTTTLAPSTWGNVFQPASLCTAANGCGYNASAEGTITAQPRLFDAQFVHPESGYGVWFPEGHRPKVSVSTYLRVRCNAQAIVSVIPWVCWKEPAV